MYLMTKKLKILDFESTNFFFEDKTLHVTSNNNDCNGTSYENFNPFPKEYFEATLNIEYFENLFIRYCSTNILPLKFAREKTLEVLSFINTDVKNLVFKNFGGVSKLYFYSSKNVPEIIEMVSSIKKPTLVSINTHFLSFEEIRRISLQTCFLNLINVSVCVFDSDLDYHGKYETDLQKKFQNITVSENISFQEIF